MPATTLYGIPNCDTVKAARAFLAAQGHPHAFHDFKLQGLPPALLDAWLAAPIAPRLLNRQGTTWRRLDPAVRAQAEADPAAARALLLAQPALVKRPVVAWADGSLGVGFDAAAWAARLG